jgi:hypothetical protein
VDEISGTKVAINSIGGNGHPSLRDGYFSLQGPHFCELSPEKAILVLDTN